MLWCVVIVLPKLPFYKGFLFLKREFKGCYVVQIYSQLLTKPFNIALYFILYGGGGRGKIQHVHQSKAAKLKLFSIKVIS